MSYFQAPNIDNTTLAGLEIAVKKTAEAVAKLERSGIDPGRFGIRLEDVKRERDEALQNYGAIQGKRRAELAEIRHQAVTDARGAWDVGDAFFAPVLYQKLARDGDGWETALHEITGIGWRLDSWQLIGSAPSPFDSNVTLIQTLFIR